MRDTCVPIKVFSLLVCTVLSITEQYVVLTSNRPVIHWSNNMTRIVTVHVCVSFSPQITMVVNNHMLLAVRTSDVEGNIPAYLVGNETSHDDLVAGRLSVQGVHVHNDLSLRRIETAAGRMIGWLVLVAYVLPTNGMVVVRCLQHHVCHTNFVEQ